ncbi:hypothetical protein C3R44_23715, partial [Mycobacterium tuberculosis]
MAAAAIRPLGRAWSLALAGPPSPALRAPVAASPPRFVLAFRPAGRPSAVAAAARAPPRVAAAGLLPAGALLAFAPGRRWPRARPRAPLAAVLPWPAGPLARLR